jgi:HEPN domain-containing protein
MSDTANNWYEIARYDLETAEAMQKEGRYLYVIFFCQQAVEKMMKGRYTQRTGEVAPKIHDLRRLSELAGIGVSRKYMQFLDELTYLYIDARYPIDLGASLATITENVANDYLNQTRGFLRWLQRQKK